MVTPPTPEDIAALLGVSADTAFRALAAGALQAVTAMARSYTRGRGFGGSLVAEDIAAVITTAALRFTASPEQVKREEFDGYSIAPTPFVGWSLVELAVLNRYRVSAR